MNTSLLYHRDHECNGIKRKEQMRLYTFKSYIAEGFCKSGKNLEHKKGRPSSSIAREYKEKRRKGPAAPVPVSDMCLDATAHWMMVAGQKR